MEAGEIPKPRGNPLDLQERPTAPSPVPAGVVRASPCSSRAAAVTRFGAELQRRMGEAGLKGVQGLFALADQLHRALATVSPAEIDDAEADLERVAEQVRTMKDNLRQLKSVKSDLEGLSRSNCRGSTRRVSAEARGAVRSRCGGDLAEQRLGLVPADAGVGERDAVAERAFPRPNPGGPPAGCSRQQAHDGAVAARRAAPAPRGRRSAGACSPCSSCRASSRS